MVGEAVSTLGAGLEIATVAFPQVSPHGMLVCVCEYAGAVDID